MHRGCSLAEAPQVGSLFSGQDSPRQRTTNQSWSRTGKNKGKALHESQDTVLQDTLNFLPTHFSAGHTKVWASATFSRFNRWQMVKMRFKAISEGPTATFSTSSNQATGLAGCRFSCLCHGHALYIPLQAPNILL